MSSETGQQGCVSPEGQNHILILNLTEHGHEHGPAVHALQMSSLLDHKFSPNQYIPSACFR